MLRTHQSATAMRCRVLAPIFSRRLMLPPSNEETIGQSDSGSDVFLVASATLVARFGRSPWRTTRLEKGRDNGMQANSREFRLRDEAFSQRRSGGRRIIHHGDPANHEGRSPWAYARPPN